jgi:hypothetical protein
VSNLFDVLSHPYARDLVPGIVRDAWESVCVAVVLALFRRGPVKPRFQIDNADSIPAPLQPL